MSRRSLVALTAGGVTLALVGWALLALEILTASVAVAFAVAGLTLAALTVLISGRGELHRTRRAHAEFRRRIEALRERHIALHGQMEALRLRADRVQADAGDLAQQVDGVRHESAQSVTEVHEWTKGQLDRASGATQHQLVAVTEALRLQLNKQAEEMADVWSQVADRLDEQAEELDRRRRQEVVLRRKVQAWERDRDTLIGQVDGLEKKISGGDIRAVSSLKEQLTEQVQQLMRVRADTLDAGVLAGKRVDRLISREDAVDLMPTLLEQRRVMSIVALLRSFDVLSALNLTQSRALLRTLRVNGYWALTERVARRVAELSGKDRDDQFVKMIQTDLKVFSDPLRGLASEPGDSARDRGGPVMHVVGKALPRTQTGYTLRTDYSVRAQAELGIPVLVVVQPGGDGVEHADESSLEEQGLERVALPGPVRGTAPLDAWMAQYVQALETLVRRRRPSLLHAHSDFLNGAAAVLVGRRCGVPVVYEARGFWEESWLSRMGDSIGLSADPEADLKGIGLPEAYTLRRSAELKVRQGADRVVTLAEVMRKHILSEHASLPEPTPRVVVSPNAVERAAFPARTRDDGLAEELEIAAGEVVIGYVSSMVEYEGIDTLIRALDGFETSRGGLGPSVKLLLVGDGPVLPELRALSRHLDVSVIFAGRVNHSVVQRYYSIIDIFVVPRRPTNVTRLVTPLKPYEAMATGKAVVVSDVAALREIADESGAAVTFPPGDAGALRSVIQRLVDDASARTELGRRAREWVITHRTWEANAQVLLDVYGSLGCRWVESRSDQNEVRERFRERGLDLSTISADIAAAEMPGRGWFSVGPDLDPERVKRDGWSWDTRAPIKLDRVSDWSIFAREDRSLALHVHAWDFVDDFFADGRPGEEDVQFLVQVALSWNADRRHRARSDASDDSMAYYDMALALRAPRLLLIIAQASRHRSTRDHVPELIDLLLQEREALTGDEAFNPRTNHGFYTAAAQLHIEKYVPGLPGRESVLEQARERMAQLVRTQFAADGGHLEHSPDYHRMLLASFGHAVDDGLIVDPALIETIRRARRVLGWMTQPDGTLVTMGDSVARLLHSTLR